MSFLFAAFLNPLLLWGLAGASIPVILHLLKRRRFREEPWAAMRFLLAAFKKNQKRIQLEQWLLLAVRTLLLACLALAMARPALEALGALDMLSGRRHWVLALDGSLSMAYAAGDENRFDQARAVAGRLVREARPGDAFSLIILAEPPRTVIGTPAFGKEAVLSALDAIVMPEGGLDLATSLEAVDAALEASDIPRKEVFLITDLQAAGWRPEGKNQDERLRALTKRWEQKAAHGQVVDLGRPEFKNRAVTSLETRPALVTVGPTVALTARVAAFGGDFSAGRAQLVVDGRVLATETQEIPPIRAGDSVELEFRHAFATAGDHLVEVRIDADPLAADDRRFRVVRARESINVLLVDGDPKPGLFQNESAFLAEALSPETDTPGQVSPIRVKTLNEAQLPQADLGDFDSVMLCNLPRFRGDTIASLDAYVRQGGGVVVFTGDQVRADNYNATLLGKNGLLPVEIDTTVGDASSRENPFYFDPVGFKHPLVADFAGQPDPVLASLTNVKTFRYHRIVVPSDSSVATALRLNDDPLIVEGRRGDGRIILVGTTVDRDWTDWPIHHSYPAIMEKLVEEGAAGRFAHRNLTVGEPIDVPLPLSAVGAEMTVRWPDAETSTSADGRREERSSVEQADSAALGRSPATDQMGAYVVEVGPPISRTELFAANAPATESDLTPIDLPALRSTLPEWTFEYVNDQKPLEKGAAQARQSGEFHRPLLWAVLGLLLLESILAWRFGHQNKRRAA